MSANRLLDRETLREAFQHLAAKLARRGIVGELHVFGGAAMVLAFNARAATRDVDALFEPDGPVLEAANEVAEQMGLPRSWLNNQAPTYVSPQAGRGVAVFDHPNLRVMTTPPQHLLAMKVRAARAARDVDEIRLLLEHLQIDQLDEVRRLIASYFPQEPLSSRSVQLLEDVLNRP